MAEMAIFNLNDISLLFGGFLSLVVAVRLMLGQSEGPLVPHHGLLLALFFLLGTLRALDGMVNTNPALRQMLITWYPISVFGLGFIYFLQGPLLFWFARASFSQMMNLTYKDALHLIPLLGYPFYLWFMGTNISAPVDPDFGNAAVAQKNAPAEVLIWAQHISLFIYSLLCVSRLFEYQRHLKLLQLPSQKMDLQGLRLLLIGFLAINAWSFIILLDSRFLHWLSPTLLGESTSHLLFIYMSVLIVYLLKNAQGFSDIQPEHKLNHALVSEEPQLQLVEKLQSFMESNKPYLEPHITVERLAIKLNVSPKLLSSTINNQLQMNFFELIGSYRVEEAKRKLADEQLRDLPIHEIMKHCGFSSKSVFNQAFKKAVGVTPSHYRQQYLGCRLAG
ncbi:helix-turn-helix domain-containing protein [Cellvibrio japonicus]|uniref:Transcriptional regulator, AraC family domain protein n=1 Tax=Cellvibrio japonicus (strain Ueda107) TaxID=498211 RepID=B3PI13_CELJU|nr:AraC family transcriptional regulator [Cellvibrio japonicus]ACE84908.1 transcriptional regulator, AraC family domain protein [Cellvibrio japonicus Ueda107]QEI11065.1 helix-turn-helix transcriptional regulator [Cellvibrio japonicus]QEI14640.1 helix-turn-helix transcriptional regulator [Cellvibrio japonicus]QEI18219.1 helix-turn-helix transcriptional regulator [Cellvibrio japonicus]